ncbi:uncharacterized protein DSM5745_00273 [Aspergillus mulundensis]|uniref:chitinase n=1 Tax=Aspergillus mulundensis TaxID=1810919 RepID=A0A3D8T3C2_9EURO|nr:hypothetical protein DSM5745_00273 [Aspergillus mulundensis]RDW92951.1 hypothetical protein DSM5745_00273 [Aspergillus mulundensis]
MLANAIPGIAKPRPHGRRDAAREGVCVPISPILHDAKDLEAKIRPPEGVCDANETIEPAPTPTNIRIHSALAANTDDDPYSCNENKPCGNGACCAKSGYCGFGPKYCGEDGKSPNDVCWSNCDAHAECGVYAETKGDECPLNVCCSQYGFCGTTAEFCDRGEDNDDDDDDEPTGCQSNCDQPGSGASGSEVRDRIIGYYEVWNHQKKCINMDIDDVPVESLTHLYYAFGYIEPETYKIVPMDDGADGASEPVDQYTFAAVAGLKKRNPDLKVIIALGGWAFNDNHTVWQPVFSDMVSSSYKRGTFIGQLELFKSHYGFDGVDFDWEYPGAEDRGGHEDDGRNFRKLLESLATFYRGTDFEISFTAPTSYWYLRHFDLKASSDIVNYVNLMSYDLHGIWDSNNPIGSQVLAHTNLTEIDKALDLLWRNDVDPSKVNLGIGFYGRSYQLADPACSQPGCLFKGGGSAGPCTGQSGILSYAEIMDIIHENNLDPVHDELNAVKYITWNQDQWVSFDDQDTIQAKIEFANSKGLGGLLIWAVDLDTPQLNALAGVIYPKKLGFRGEKAKGADNWEELSEGECYASECSKNPTCKEGFIKADTFWCGDDDWPLNRPDGEQAICCPVSSVPDVSKCTWHGGDDGGEFCNGQCHDGEVAVVSSKWGDHGSWCIDGRKFFCCPTEVQQPDCRWTGCDEQCKDNEDEMTWRDSVCKEKLCCNSAQKWENCAWHGKPGSCFDNHCDTGWQVAVTNSFDGEGDDCGITGRKRTFCCDLPDGVSPFLPVPLEYLFPDAPDEDEVNSDFVLKVDPTWGGSEPEEFMILEEEPDEAPFGFVVMTSPAEIQQSLDKRDGSHWEVFDCLDATTIGEHRVRMVCTDTSEQSNCGNIHWGHGAPGTIIQMPQGCGPGKYAVVKDLSPSVNQTLPGSLARRGLLDTVYDLTFDYDFKRVPRDLGETNLRIDYSNDVDYWDNIVDKAADVKKRRKRELHDVNGNHRRWLEEEWRDDAHFGGVSSGDLHKRWFGSSIIDWLRNIIGTVEKTIEFGHHFTEDYILKIVDQQLSCPSVEAYLDVHAETHVEAHVSYGFTVIAKLDHRPIDLSDSFLYFRTKGEVTASFVIDGAATYSFDTGNKRLFSADKFGAAFTVPGIVTVGPNFEVNGQIEGAATLGVNFESRVKLAGWDIEQTYPIPETDKNDYTPQLEKSPNKDGFQTPQVPEIEWSVGVNGYVTAHIKPSISFGIMWDDLFFDIEDCAVRLTADGHITFHASAGTGSSGTNVCVGIDAGADLYATIDAPDAIDWALPKTPYYLLPSNDIELYSKCWTPDTKRSEIPALDAPTNSSIRVLESTLQRRNYLDVDANSTAHGKHLLGKRAQVWGPLLPNIPIGCPNDEQEEISPCPECTYGDYDTNSLRKRDGAVCAYYPGAADEELCGPNDDLTTSGLEKRVKGKAKTIKWDYNGVTETLTAVYYPSCGVATKLDDVEKWYGYAPRKCSPRVVFLSQNEYVLTGDEYVTEHIYEAQTVKYFLEWLINGPLPGGYTTASREWVSEVLIGLAPNTRAPFAASDWVDLGGPPTNLWERLFLNIGSDDKLEGLVIAEKNMNSVKNSFFGRKNPTTANDNNDESLTRNRHRSTAGVFWYMKIPAVWATFVEASQGIAVALYEFDEEYIWGSEQDEIGLPPNVTPDKRGNRGLRELYCYWIDVYLRDIETRGETWRTAARANYQAEFGNTGWLQQFDNGDMRAGSIKFPAAGGSRHGAAGIWTRSNYKNLWTAPGGGFGPY